MESSLPLKLDRRDTLIYEGYRYETGLLSEKLALSTGFEEVSLKEPLVFEKLRGARSLIRGFSFFAKEI